jgi:hypothetical protein
MNSPQNKIFIFFWNIGQYPLEFYKHVVKSRNARKTILVFKKSMRKYIFETSNVFFLYIKKERSKHVRVLAVCKTQENIFYFYFFSKRKHHN